MISVIAAIGKNRAIGKDNTLLWHIPDDLKHFKEVTLGSPIIMGRKTFESILSILGKPLPQRINIVVTRNDSWTYPGVVVASSIDDAVQKARSLNHPEVFIGGGGELYTQALPLADRIYLTLIDDEKEGDVFFPDYSPFSKVISREKRKYGEINYEWLVLER
ncbi:hypothetical protein COU15_02980 [Candidatus Kaiserbacteria bacterium CG10_big_fil_rev_8_21_14_0_10_45_20]|uniref:Dihydrofolate reductase n=1 Tax=Candidatus Kaiserbacteria bacterium CG10_big_fil_rev_8_21_14_0_10_45_20 TaxID=1974607 RepID=A0A2H0UF75_9BACT|nr:MAG: hypothetical protein COU15_02980 [Candidatus Kaiserbacteria bacterium CG10_big_fil_rev_8_21_14_0_10_45_20]